jgi:hypothetical protein
MNLFEINDICSDPLKVIEYLQDQGILHKEMQCIPCQYPCWLNKEPGKLTGYVWRCSKCRRKHSVLKGSFLEGSKIVPRKFLNIVFYWASKTPLNTAIHHLDMSSRTGVQYFQWIRNICYWKLLNSSVELGGPGLEVQIDESLLVMAKYYRGRNIGRQQWVFGD